uniref:LRRNT domain-containing protein n=1 Tax=Anabas testudineus TaxID=64144 RepID=A0A7N6B3D5_ANATE
MQFPLCLMLVILWGAQTLEGCPDFCECSRKSGPEKSEVNCHKKGLRAFPSNLPPDAWVLHLGGYLAVNKITSRHVVTF